MQTHRIHSNFDMNYSRWDIAGEICSVLRAARKGVRGTVDLKSVIEVDEQLILRLVPLFEFRNTINSISRETKT